MSILCVTRGERHAWPFLRHLADLADLLGAELVIGADRMTVEERCRVQDLAPEGAKVLSLFGRGYLESVLEEAVSVCSGDYVLRMDDDERCSSAMAQWLLREEYLAKPHWKFCTANLWGDDKSLLYDAPLWPDHHTRLSVKSMAGGRHTPHCGSPYGGGELAPVIHEHHKFLVKTYEERLEIARRYDAFQPGYGTSDGMRPFSLPETCYQQFVLAPLGDGTLREFCETDLRRCPVPSVVYP